MRRRPTVALDVELRARDRCAGRSCSRPATATMRTGCWSASSSPVVELVETPAAWAGPRRLCSGLRVVSGRCGWRTGDVVAVRCGRARGGHRQTLGTRSVVVDVPVVAVVVPGDPATVLSHPATGKILPTKLPGPCGTRGS